MNMQAIMAQAQRMQKDLMKKKDELNKMEFNGNSELVDVVMMGDKKLKSVKIKLDNLSDDDKEVIEDMIVIAINDAITKIEKETENVMGPLSGSLGGLF